VVRSYWARHDGRTSGLPYNRQAFRQWHHDHDRLMIGTVDKFQGRQAPVVIYSMATSSADDAPRAWSSCTTCTGLTSQPQGPG
jgi:hypothetical protein